MAVVVVNSATASLLAVCLVFMAVGLCTGQIVDVKFPSCRCERELTPFAIKSAATQLTSRNPGVVNLYCFEIGIVNSGSGACYTEPASQNLSKVSVYAQAAQRDRLSAFGVLLAGAPVSNMTYLTPRWDSLNMTTISNLNFSKTQANGTRICLELFKPTTINEFCEREGASGSFCWVALFNDNNCVPPNSTVVISKRLCCPRFQSILSP
ncbi:sex-inducer, sex-inducing pheromone [Volvox carteri f. nagariensis]|uniref:Sex-inducer, sex-inducing pheromone n=1 Tax=Volvox carteri f. nagariensis TaxID=3068 RepID=D8UDS0_VOLCA|nr:sex-inducer, sex-inducing pheromone [Volvox carteri f. nagariensis]EFJ42143.1 sex-inducer, sex-inducing pheromone [Volvox carteri f. nagariensis]|eukprot:XP_002956840.1 sex-inducer, sex-inducing pheromone [Volvox carteri f. nagariensis]